MRTLELEMSQFEQNIKLGQKLGKTYAEMMQQVYGEDALSQKKSSTDMVMLELFFSFKRNC